MANYMKRSPTPGSRDIPKALSEDVLDSLSTISFEVSSRLGFTDDIQRAKLAAAALTYYHKYGEVPNQIGLFEFMVLGRKAMMPPYATSAIQGSLLSIIQSLIDDQKLNDEQCLHLVSYVNSMVSK